MQEMQWDWKNKQSIFQKSSTNSEQRGEQVLHFSVLKALYRAFGEKEG